MPPAVVKRYPERLPTPSSTAGRVCRSTRAGHASAATAGMRSRFGRTATAAWETSPERMADSWVARIGQHARTLGTCREEMRGYQRQWNHVTDGRMSINACRSEFGVCRRRAGTPVSTDPNVAPPCGVGSPRCRNISPYRPESEIHKILPSARFAASCCVE